MNNNEILRKKVLKRIIVLLMCTGLLSFGIYNYSGLKSETALNVIIVLMIITSLSVKVLSREFKNKSGVNNTPVKIIKSQQQKKK